MKLPCLPRSTRSLTLLAVLLASLHAHAADPEAAAKAARYAEHLKQYDKNGNGKLDPEEQATRNADKRRAADLKEYDSNRDGQLDAAETARLQADAARAALEPAEPPEDNSPAAKAARYAAHLKKYDLNGNGQLDPEERAQKAADKRERENLKRYDLNHDGRLDAEETAAMAAAAAAKSPEKNPEQRGNGGRGFHRPLRSPGFYPSSATSVRPDKTAPAAQR